MSGTRIDKWLWSVRLFKTRSAANQACGAGRVRVAGSPAKPATRLVAGAEVSVRTRGVTRTYRVDRIIDKRVGAAIASECYTDLTPPESMPPPLHRPGGRSRRDETDGRVDAAWGERERGSGRPTKRDRRQMDKFLNRPER